RRRLGRYLLEGPTLLQEALESGAAVEAVALTQAAYDRHRALAAWAEEGGASLYLVDDRVLAGLADTTTPQGLVASARERVVSFDDALQAGGPTLVLAGVGDPGNAGTLLRGAEAFGANGVCFVDDAVDAFAPKVVRAAMGATFRLQIARGDGAALASLAKAHGRAIVVADLEGEACDRFNFPAEFLLVVGHERRGPAAWLERADARVRIPQAGRVESLNAAMAGSILLYEAARKRQ
ncbi:MAG: RNA methyltransferase, partial [bacterium]|nr:RNA methyltransferase [bacterium]